MDHRRNQVVIFGTTPFASVVRYYFEKLGERSVAAYTVDAAYLQQDQFDDRPAVAFESLVDKYPTATTELFVAAGYADGNRLRDQRIKDALRMGYSLASYVDPTSVVNTDLIGRNCLISEGAIIQPFASVGDGCIIRAGAIIGHHNHLGGCCWISSAAAISGHCTLGERVFLGTGVNVRDECEIVSDCTVGVGATVTRSLKTPGFYLGSPARKAPDRE